MNLFCRIGFHYFYHRRNDTTFCNNCGATFVIKNGKKLWTGWYRQGHGPQIKIDKNTFPEGHIFYGKEKELERRLKEKVSPHLS